MKVYVVVTVTRVGDRDVYGQIVSVHNDKTVAKTKADNIRGHKIRGEDTKLYDYGIADPFDMIYSVEWEVE